VVFVAVGVFLSQQEPEPVSIKGYEIQESDHTLGNPDAKVEFIEYGDFQCPACAAQEPNIKKLMAENSDWIHFAYRHLPLKQIHPNAVAAGRASEAAANQGKFWEMKELLYSKQTEWATLPDPTSKFLEFSNSLSLDENRFVSDYNSGESRDRVEADYQTAVSLGLNSTPSFFVNGEQIQSPGTYEQLLQIMQNARANAEQSPAGTVEDIETEEPANPAASSELAPE
jgi:protein-disulfide isomerase